MNGKVALATVPKSKKAHHRKSKAKKEPNPTWEQFIGSWERFCLTLLACVVFILEFVPNGLEGACRGMLKMVQRKEKG